MIRVFSIASLLGLYGCDLESLLADPKVAQRQEEGKAIGGSCRQGLRAIEDCFSMNAGASKAAIFNGWKEMDQYMRDNKIEGVEPKGTAPAPVPDGAEDTASKDKGQPEATQSKKASEKSKAASK